MSRKPAARFLLVTDGALPEPLAGLPSVSADAYLEGQNETLEEHRVVVNLCRSYQYLSKGYYVSLLAEARRQRIYPSLEEIEAIGNPFTYFRWLQETGVKTLDYQIVPGRSRLVPKVMVVPREPRSKSADRPALVRLSEGVRFEPLEAGFVEITTVFGRTPDHRFKRQAAAVFRMFSFPLLEIRFYHTPEGFRVGRLAPLPITQAEPEDLARLREAIEKGPSRLLAPAPEQPTPHRIACLWDPDDELAPSDEDAIERFERVAARRGVLFETIGLSDIGRLPEFDALLIRTVTAVGHPSFNFAQTAETLGIPVIDDPSSILKCSNKIFLYELFRKHGLPMPETAVLSRKSYREDVAPLGFPVILKVPDGTFSQSVKKAETPEELESIVKEMFKKSPLLIAQKFMPTAFDWRVGLLRGKVLWVARYHMARDHWQIAQRTEKGGTRYGRVEAVPAEQAPPEVLELARTGAALLGDGLYGADIKETEHGPVLIEINDNPNLEAGYEDAVTKDGPYEEILDALLERIEEEGKVRRPRA